MKEQEEFYEPSIRDRLRQFLKYINESPEDFYKKVCLSQGYLYHDQSGINSDILQKIKKVYYSLNLEWLITGEGVMIKPFYGYTNLKIKFTGKAKKGEITWEQLVAKMEEINTTLQMTLNDAQKTIRLQEEKIELLKKDLKDAEFK